MLLTVGSTVWCGSRCYADLYESATLLELKKSKAILIRFYFALVGIIFWIYLM